MPTETKYGAKCNICAHLVHPDKSEKRWEVHKKRACQACYFCQEEALCDDLGKHRFTPEGWAALRAFREGDFHPLLYEARAGMLK